MRGFPGVYGQQRMTASRSNVTMSSTSVAAGGSIGAWTTTPVQLVASTAHDATVVKITNIAAVNNSGLRGDYAFQLLAGGSGSEYPIIDCLLFGARPAYSEYTLPIYIPAGTRLSAKTAAGVASRAITFNIEYYGEYNRDMQGIPSRWVVYGPGTPGYGKAVTPGNSSAWGSWTSVTLGTTYDHVLWLAMTGIGTATTVTAQNYRVQVALDSTSAAATIATNGTGLFELPWLTGSTTEQLGAHNTATYPVIYGPEHIIYAPRAAGWALSARATASSTADSNATTVAILGGVV
jgi:hypothetical protein